MQPTSKLYTLPTAILGDSEAMYFMKLSLETEWNN